MIYQSTCESCGDIEIRDHSKKKVKVVKHCRCATEKGLSSAIWREIIWNGTR